MKAKAFRGLWPFGRDTRDDDLPRTGASSVARQSYKTLNWVFSEDLLHGLHPCCDMFQSGVFFVMCVCGDGVGVNLTQSSGPLTPQEPHFIL